MFDKPKKFEKYSLKGLLSEFNDYTKQKNTLEVRELPGERRRGLKKDVFDFLSLMSRWKEVVGEKLVEHTYPLKNKNKVLYILTDHPVYAEQLSFMGEVIKQKIFTIFPSLKSEIRDLKFEQCEKQLFEKLKPRIIEEQEAFEKKNIKTLHPQSPLYKQLKLEADQLYQNIQDSEVKELLTSLYIQIKAKDLGACE